MSVETIVAVVKAILFLIITGVLAIKPRFLWDNVGKWYSENEPSEFYFDMLRIFCTIFFFVVLYALYAELFGPLF